MHELPGELTVVEQRAVIERAAEVLEPLTGERPVGYRAPWWQLTLEAPGKLLEIWQGELEAFHEEGCLQVRTMHPFLSGRPARSRHIGRFVRFARELGDVWFATAREVAEHARSVLDDSGARRLRSALDRGYGMREAGGSDGAT